MDYEPLLEAIQAHPSEVDDLRDMLKLTHRDEQIRASFGRLLRDTYAELQPESYETLSPLLETYLGSPFGKLPMTVATAFTVLVGSRCYPNGSLVDAGNTILEHAISQHASFPLVKTLFNSCGGHWGDFLTDHEHWERILWSVSSSIVERSENQVVLDVEAPVAIYTNQGFWRGMMKLFELSNGQHIILDHNMEGMRIMLTW